MKSKVVALKKLDFQSGVCFLIWCILDHGLYHLLDFKGEWDPLQQYRLQGQNQFWFIVSKIYCNFMVEFISDFSSQSVAPEVIFFFFMSKLVIFFLYLLEFLSF